MRMIFPFSFRISIFPRKRLSFSFPEESQVGFLSQLFTRRTSDSKNAAVQSFTVFFFTSVPIFFSESTRFSFPQAAASILSAAFFASVPEMAEFPNLGGFESHSIVTEFCDGYESRMRTVGHFGRFDATGETVVEDCPADARFAEYFGFSTATSPTEYSASFFKVGMSA